MNTVLCDDTGGIHKAADEVGDKWSLLIMWAALHGTTRFEVFQIDLGVARSVLSHRLSKLVDAHILTKRPIRRFSPRMEYRLTAKGEALRPALERIDAWGRSGAVQDNTGNHSQSDRRAVVTRR